MQLDRLRDILVFMRVLECGNLSAAARSFSLSPSTVSKLITRLEDRLRTRLLDRSSRTLSPTADGIAFHRSCLAVMESLEEAEGAVLAHGRTPLGTLRLHTVPAFAKYQLSRVLPEFLARYPGIEIELILDVDHTALLSTGVDVAIHTGWVADSSLIARRFASSRWIICASPEYLARHGVPRTPDELLAHNCLCQPQSSPWSPWLVSDDGTTRSLPVRGNVITNLADTLIELACAGLGIIRIAEFCAADYLRSGRLVQVLAGYRPKEEQPIIAYYRSRRNLSPRIRVFVDFLHERFASGPWRTCGTPVGPGCPD